MRTTEGKPVLDVRLVGPRAMATRVADALAAVEREDRHTHGFHTWPAGLHPRTARELLALMPGRELLDPFCGGGTTLIEGLLAGRRVVGRDLSPVAVLVASARTCVTDEAARTAMRSAARRAAERAMSASVLPSSEVLAVVEGWYEPHVLCELEALRAAVAEVEGQAGLLLRCVLSSIVVKASLRASDTSVRREAIRRPPGTTATLFHKKARELGRRLEALAQSVPADVPAADVALSDARTPLGHPVDAVLTSPPYPAVYDYLPIQDLRHAWLGVQASMDQEIGPRRSWRERSDALELWRADTAAWMGAVDRSLRPGGAVGIVIGDGLVARGPVDTFGPTVGCATDLGWRKVCGASVLRPDHARETGRWEHALMFEKPAR